MDKVYIVLQGADSYSNVEPAIFVFLSEAAARVKFEHLRERTVYGGGNSDDLVWTELHAVPPGSEVTAATRIDSH